MRVIIWCEVSVSVAQCTAVKYSGVELIRVVKGRAVVSNKRIAAIKID